jgi:telomerase reverse transcriptase
MGMKRKYAEGTPKNRPRKRSKPTNHPSSREQKTTDKQHKTLSAYYPRVCSLRGYLLDSLPSTSRFRRRLLTAYAKDDTTSILDTCLVGVLSQPSPSASKSRKADYVTFTQTQRASALDASRPARCCIEEVDHISRLGSRETSTSLTGCTGR